MMISRQKRLLERVPFNELISVVAHMEDKGLFELIHDDDKGRSTGFDIGAAWFGVPAVGISNQTVSDLEEILNIEFPPDTLLQFQKLATPDIEGTIKAYNDNKRTALSFATSNHLTEDQKKSLRGLVKAREQFLMGGREKPLIKGTNHVLKEDIVIVSMRVPFKKPPSMIDIDKIASAASRMEGQLRKIGIAPKRMGPQAYLDAFHAIVRLGSDDQTVEYDNEVPVRDQAAHSEDYIKIEADHCKVNGNCIRSLSAHTFPKRYHLGRMLTLFGDVLGSNRQIDDPFLATLHILIPDHVKARDEWVKTKGWTDNFNRGQIRMLSSRVRHLADEHKQLENAIGHEGALVKVWFNWLTFSPTREKALESAQNFKAMARSFQWDLRADDRMHHHAFLNALPMNSEPRLIKQLNRYQTKGAIHAAHLVPVVGEWSGNSGDPIQLYISRRGALMSINSWQSSQGYNGIIAATTGSGKSVQIMDLAVNMMAAGVKVNLLDKGRSFMAATKILGGTYFDFDKPGAYNLNPFKQVKDINEESEQLGIIFQTMADPQMRLDNFQEPVLTKIIREGWDELGEDCTIDWVQQRCVQDEDQRVKDLGVMLEAYTSKGEHGAWFVEGEPLTFGTNALTSIELSSLDSKPKLQAVVLQMVLMELQRICYSEAGTNVRTITVIDEAADLLVQNGPATFAERMARQARKYGAGLWVVTQLLSDLVRKIPTGVDIMGNSAFKFLMRQKSEVIRELKSDNWAGLDEYEVHMLENVHTEPGSYSETLYITPNGSGVGRLVLPREHQLMYTTDPGEKNAIANYRKMGMSTFEAIQRVVADERKHTESTSLERRRAS
jgi:conjugal transfer ATP-binding protein TraC